jgi:hypothetical protein
MDEERYINYQKNIADFLESDHAKKFSTDYFANTIAKKIIEEMSLITPAIKATKLSHSELWGG